MATLGRPVRRRSGADFTQRLSHYFRIVWRRKGLALLVALVTSAGAVGFMLHRGFMRPELEVRVVLGMESPGQWGALDEYSDVGAYRVELIRSRGFVQHVVDTLSLRMVLTRHDRDALFDSLRVDSAAISGLYFVDVDDETGGSYEVFYRPAQGRYDNRLVQTGRVAERVVRLPGLLFVFSEGFAAAPHDFSFRILSTQRAVDKILSKMTVTPPTRQEPDHFIVTLTGRDYPLITRTLNTMASSFVAKNSALRRRRTKERLRILESQLDEAKSQLKESETALRRFLSAHPTVSLEGRIASTVGELVEAQSEARTTKQDLEEAQRLLSAYQQASGSAAHSIVGEMLAFLESKDVASARFLRQEFTNLLSEHAELSRTHIEGHPLVEFNERKIRAVAARARTALQEYRDRLRKQRTAKTKQINRLSGGLRDLPQNSLRLAELKRKQEINSQIYSNLQSRYNEAKVADAVSMADVYVIDQAVEPLPPPFTFRLARVVILAVLAALAAISALVLLVDLMNRTALTEYDVSQMTDLQFLQSIPVVKMPRSSRRKRRTRVNISSAR